MPNDNKSALSLEAMGVNLPYNTEAEQAVLGSVLSNAQVLDDVSAILKPEYFYSRQNGEIFREMLLLQSTEKAVDFVTVLDAVVNAGVFSTPEDAKVYLYSVFESVPAVSNVRDYARIVADKYKTRSVIRACAEVMESAQDGQTPADSLLDLAEQKMYDIRGGKDNSDMSKIVDVSYNVLSDLEKLSGEDREQYLGIPTGFTYLDSVITGLNKSDLIVLAARPGVGKTSLALNIATNVARSRRDLGVAMFSLEMTNEQLAQRIFSSVAGVRSQKFRTGDFNDEEMERITEAVSEMAGTGIYLDDTSGITPPEIKAKARRVKNLGLVIIDYLQLMSGSGRNENRVNEISEITRSFKIMAKDLKVPVILISQLSRDNEKNKRRPVLSDLRDSGSIEQDADIVLFLHNEAQQEDTANTARNQEVLLMVAKNRHGERVNLRLNFEGESTRFTSIDYEHYE